MRKDAALGALWLFVLFACGSNVALFLRSAIAADRAANLRMAEELQRTTTTFQPSQPPQQEQLVPNFLVQHETYTNGKRVESEAQAAHDRGDARNVVMWLAHRWFTATVARQDAPSCNRLEFLRESLRSVAAHYFSVWPDPVRRVVLFHVGLPAAAKLALLEASGCGNVTFVQVNTLALLEYSGVNGSLARAWDRGEFGGTAGRGVGYRTMCTAFCGPLQAHAAQLFPNALRYMRLDDDSFFTGDLSEEDPFARCQRDGIVYAYRTQFSESRGGDELLALVRDFAREHPGFFDMQHIEEELASHWRAPYNNFHVSTFEFWKRPLVVEFLRRAREAHGLLKLRWGDAQVHAVLLTTLAQNETAVLDSIPYRHNFHVCSPGKESWRFDGRDTSWNPCSKPSHIPISLSSGGFDVTG